MESILRDSLKMVARVSASLKVGCGGVDAKRSLNRQHLLLSREAAASRHVPISILAKQLLPLVDCRRDPRRGMPYCTGTVYELGPRRSTLNLSLSVPGFGTASAVLAHFAVGFLYTTPTAASPIIVLLMNLQNQKSREMFLLATGQRCGR